MLSPIYSSGSSSKPAPSAISSSCLTLKQSLIYFRKTSPSTTLLYSAASRLPRNSFAESHNVCSMVFFATSFVFAFFAMVVYKSKNSITIPARQTKAYKTAKEFRMLFILILQVISAVAFSVTKVMPFRGFSCIIQK